MNSKKTLNTLWDYFDYFCSIGVVTKEEESEIDKCFEILKEEVK